MSTFIEFLGISGGFILTSSIIPQIIKCARTKSTKDLSWSMYGIYYIGILINFIYGIAIHHPAIYISCIYSFCTNSTLVYMKWKFERDDYLLHDNQVENVGDDIGKNKKNEIV